MAIPRGLPDAPWAFIAVMGVTGAGKSTFIQTISGCEEVVIGHGLESCTSQITGYTFHHAGYNINLIDTPGFNDTHKSETEVLQDLADWLQTSYEKHTLLTGVIYLHSINNVRMEGSALRNLRMFRQLCGEEPLKNVVLATTFWGKVDHTTALSREEELRSNPDFWGQMIERGSAIRRFTDRKSGLDVISQLLNLAPVTLKIQRELVDLSKPLIETAAGQSVNEELVRLEQKHRQEMGQLQEEIQDALREKDRELQEILEDRQRKLDHSLNRVQRQQEQLRSQRRAERRQMENEFSIRMRQVELQHQRDREQWEERLFGRSSDTIQDMSFDELVRLIRSNEIKIRPEERDRVEVLIGEIEKRSEVGSKTKRRAKGTAKILLKALNVILPLATMGLLGVPISFPFSSLLGDGDDS